MKKQNRWIKITLWLVGAIVVLAAGALAYAYFTKKNCLLKLLIPNEMNEIVTYTPATELNIVKLAKSQHDRPLRVVHIGDSHIQAGTLTQTLRNLLSTRLDEAAQSEGMIFPYNVAKTNSPSAYTFKADGHWTFDKITLNSQRINAGLAGIYLETTTPQATLTVNLTAYAAKNSSFDRVRIYYMADPQSFTPQIADTLILNSTQGLNYHEFVLKSPQKTLQITMSQTDKAQRHFHLTGIQLENSRSRLIYSALGVNGASAKSYLRALDLVPQLASLQPNLVIVSLGTNDAYNDGFSIKIVEEQLDQLVRSIRIAAPACPILLTIPPDHFWMQQHSNPNLLPVREAIIRIAHKHGCHTWDLFNIMGGPGSMLTWKNMGYSAPDMIHFSKAGYELQAEMLYQALTGEKSKLRSFQLIN